MASLETEFVANILAVFFNGSRTDKQLFADFFAGQVLGDQFQNPAFGLGQFIYRGLLFGQNNCPTAAVDEKGSQ